MIQKQFGDRLKELRKEFGLTQEELAEKFNTGKSSISNYESNSRFPSAYTVGGYADFFNVSVDYILGRTDVKNIYSKIENPTANETDKSEKIEVTVYFSERIKNLMILKDLTAEELSKTLKIDKDELILYIMGKEFPNLEVFKRIAQILNTTTDYLLGLSSEPNIAKKDNSVFQKSNESKDYQKFKQQTSVSKKITDYAIDNFGSSEISSKLSDIYGRSLGEQGHFFDALKYLNKANEMYTELDANANRPLLMAVNNQIAYTYRELGHYKEALKLYKEGYDYFTACNDTHAMLECLDQIAYLYGKEENYEQAIIYSKEAIKKRELLLPDDDFDLPVSLNSLGYAYYKTNELDLAEECYQKATEIRIKHLGSNHPRVAANYNNIAKVQTEKREYSKAIKNLIHALKILRDTVSYEHPHSIITAKNIINIRIITGKYLSSEKYCRRIISGLLKKYDKNNPHVLETTMMLGDIYANTGRQTLAKKCYASVYAVQKEKLGNDKALNTDAYKKLINLGGHDA